MLWFDVYIAILGIVVECLTLRASRRNAGKIVAEIETAPYQAPIWAQCDTTLTFRLFFECGFSSPACTNKPLVEPKKISKSRPKWKQTMKVIVEIMIKMETRDQSSIKIIKIMIKMYKSREPRWSNVACGAQSMAQPLAKLFRFSSGCRSTMSRWV